MNGREKMLIFLMERERGAEAQAILLQSYIQSEGPLSEEAAAKVRELMAKGKGK